MGSLTRLTADALVSVVGKASVGRVGGVTVGRGAVRGRVERGGVVEVVGRARGRGGVARESRGGAVGTVRELAVLLVYRVGGRAG